MAGAIADRISFMEKTSLRACIIFIPLSLALVLSLLSCAGQTPPGREEISGSGVYVDWGRNPPMPKDMARHALTGAQPFEWWYFDGHLDSGETFVGVFFDPNFSNGKPGATFSLYKPDWTKEAYAAVLEPGEMRSSTEDVDMICPLGYVHRLGPDSFAVGWDIQGIKADFTLTTLAPGWLPNAPGVNTEGLDFFWAVHQGRNRVEGTIVKDGKARSVTGEGYADHNWGRKKLNEITRSWIWGRILAGEYTIVYADVNYRDASIVSRPLYAAKGDEMIIGTGNPAVRQGDFAVHPALGRPYPRLIEIQYAAGGVETRLRITCRTIVEDIDLLTVSGMDAFGQWIARTFIARPCYYRIIADYEGEIVENGSAHPIRGECLYEVMNFE